MEDVKDVCRLLEFLAAEMAANRNFELVQAVLRVTMQVSPTGDVAYLWSWASVLKEDGEGGSPSRVKLVMLGNEVNLILASRCMLRAS